MPINFCIKTAEHTIKVSALYESTFAFCRDYITEGPHDLELSISPDDIEYERLKSIKESLSKETEPVSYSDAYLETLALYRKIASGLLTYDVLLFHGSAVSVDGEAYLFTAASGTGKSTHTRLWTEQFGKRAVMINDDKPLLKIAQTGITVYGTPWNGKHRLGSNISAPLKAICILNRSAENRIEKIDKHTALPMLIQQCYRPDNIEKLHKTLLLTDCLGSTAKLFRLDCNMDPVAAEIAYSGMNT